MTDDMNPTRTFDVTPLNECEGQLHVQLTDEGIIVDLFIDDCHQATWGMTAQEFLESVMGWE